MCAEVKRALTRPVPVIDPKSQWNSNLKDDVDYDDDTDDDNGGKQDCKKRPKGKKKTRRKCKQGRKLPMPVELLLKSTDVAVTPEKRNKTDLGVDDGSTPLKQRRKNKGPIIEGMQPYEDVTGSLKPASVLKPANVGKSPVSYSALMTAYNALAQLRGLSKQAARACWLGSPERAKCIAQMSVAELCRRRLGAYAGSRKNKSSE